MWNTLSLKCPTDDLCEYSSLEGAVLQELPRLVSLLTTSAELLTQEHPIWAEIKVFRNVQEKYKRILRCDKCLQLLQRVGICLRKMVLLNLSKVYLDLAEKFLGGLQSQNAPLQLPSCQQLEFVLLRTQSAAKLICEALHYSRETFCYLIQRLRVGHLILSLMMATSVTARINILFRGLLIQVYDIYKKLYIWRKKLKKGTAQWPKPLELPNDLEAWLKPEAAELLKPKQIPKGELSFLSNFFEKKESGENSAFVSSTTDDECIIVEETSKIQFKDLDVGEVIPRPKKNKKKAKYEIKEAQSFLLEKIRSATSLKTLKHIWNNLDVNSQDILTPCKVKAMDETFHIARNKLHRIKQSDLPTDVKKQLKVDVIQSTGIKLAEYLGLINTETELSTNVESSSTNAENSSVNSESSSESSLEELEPAKNLKEFRQLYETLYESLLSKQQFKKSGKLQKKFKSRRSDIKKLIQNKKKKLAKELINYTSKEFLTKFK